MLFSQVSVDISCLDIRILDPQCVLNWCELIFFYHFQGENVFLNCQLPLKEKNCGEDP